MGGDPIFKKDVGSNGGTEGRGGEARVKERKRGSGDQGREIKRKKEDRKGVEKGVEKVGELGGRLKEEEEGRGGGEGNERVGDSRGGLFRRSWLSV